MCSSLSWLCAQSAKAERKAIALDKELSRLRQQQAEANKQRVLSLPLLLRILFFAWLALQSGWYGHSVILTGLSWSDGCCCVQERCLSWAICSPKSCGRWGGGWASALVSSGC